MKEFNVLPGSILCLHRFALANGKHLICGGHTDGAILAWNPQVRTPPPSYVRSPKALSLMGGLPLATACVCACV